MNKDMDTEVVVAVLIFGKINIFVYFVNQPNCVYICITRLGRVLME